MKRLLITASILALAAPAAHAQQGRSPAMAPAAETQSMTDTFMVFFGLGQSKLTPEARDVVAKAAQDYKKTGSARIEATGFTDTTGSAEYNQRLSERRAQSVADELVRLGVPASVIVTTGRGQNDLLVPTGDGVAEPQNRRVEIVTERPAPVAAVAAPVAEPVAAAAAPFMSKGSVALGAWYGFSIKEADATSTVGKRSAHLGGGELTGEVMATRNIPLKLSLVAYNTLGTATGDGMGYRGAVGTAWEFMSRGSVHPYFGVNGGYITGKGVQDGPLAGPELGVKFDLGERVYMYTKVGYDYLFRNSWDEGLANAGIGAGYRF